VGHTQGTESVHNRAVAPLFTSAKGSLWSCCSCHQC